MTAPSEQPSSGSTPASAIAKDAQTVAADTTLRAAAETMRAGEIGFLPVVDAGKPIGVVTDRDLAIRGTGRGLEPDTATVSAIMTPIIASVTTSQDLQQVAQVMRDRRVRRVVVVDDDGRLAGVISLTDLAHAERTSADMLAGVLMDVTR